MTNSSGGRGFLATFVGCLVGGVVLGVAGFAVGAWYADRFMQGAELEGLLPPLVGTVGGAALGAGVGAWLALRTRGYRAAAITGFFAFITGPLLLVFGAVAADRVVSTNGASLWFVVVASAFLTSLAARGVVVIGAASSPTGASDADRSAVD
ncbi:MAG TPA: hypothetical protein VFK89_12400 [Actinomycetota bacterium]|nr:hypothetical protein [Actinomycetota bacterium]